MTAPTPETRYRAALERIRDYPVFGQPHCGCCEPMHRIAREALEEEPIRTNAVHKYLCPKCGTWPYTFGPGIATCPHCGARLKVEF